MPLEAGAAETRVEDALGAEGGVADAVEEAEDEALPEGLALAVEDGVAGLVAEGSEAGAAEEAAGADWLFPLLAKTEGPGAENLLKPSAQISGNLTLS